MKTLYLDIFSGISGDMFIGALIDLGADARKLERELQKLKLDGYHLHVTRKQKSGIEGVKFDVHLTDACDHHHGHHQDPERVRSSVPPFAGRPSGAVRSHRVNAELLSLTPCFSGVWSEAKANQPLQRFPVRRKPLKRLRRQVSHQHPAKAGC